MTSFLMSTRVENGVLEAEPVTVDRVGNILVLTLDDGQKLVLEWSDLCAAVEERRAA